MSALLAGVPATAAPPARALPGVWPGVTIESVENIDQVVKSLSAHSVKPMVRIVFQENMAPAHYKEAIDKIRPHAYIMGEILDSTALGRVSLETYRTRTRAYIAAFGNNVDVWEIGNELNAEWAGSKDSINKKVAAAYDVAEREYAHLNLRTAVTLNYWPSAECHMYPWEATVPFATQMPAKVRDGVDYLLLSFYETACDPPARPAATDFVKVFKQLAPLFPRAQLGMGEVGAQGKDEGLPDPSLAERVRVARTYYGIHPTLRAEFKSRYVGGYFWWYYTRDCVEAQSDESLCSTLDGLFRTLT